MAELGVQLAHVDGGVPNIRIEIPRIDEYYIGALLYFFERSCGISGYLLGINPFDQPGVEAYKKNMFALLDKPGYEKRGRRTEKTDRITLPARARAVQVFDVRLHKKPRCGLCLDI